MSTRVRAFGHVSTLARREAVTMALYVCLVQASELIAIRDRLDSEASALAAIWSTSVGLTLAHVFAFGLAAKLVGGGGLARDERVAIVLQVAASVVVAGILSLPLLLFPLSTALQVAAFLAAAFVGLTGYGVARENGRSTLSSIAVGAAMLAVGTAVVLLKALLSH